ncbi:MAG: hypothetical protein KIT44_04305 [Opitutaceae bacterium]|nr:hypothetical protein [Opitutaceae bacterium]
MKILTSALAAGLLGFLPVATQAKIERLVEKSFPVSPGANLKVSTEGGHITLKTGADSTVTIIARQKIRAASEAEADELLQELELTMEQTADGIAAAAKYPARKSGWSYGRRPVQVDFEITAPAALNAELRTSGGNIEVGDLTGTLSARTSGGNIRLGHMAGETTARTSGGNVTLEQASGPAELRTSGGHIKALQIGHSLRAHTSGGHVTVGFSGPLQADSSLSTSGGHIKVTVTPAAAFRLDAATSGGRVSAEGVTIALGKTSRTRLEGDVNGGGPLLKLRTSGGHVNVAVEPAGR